MASNKLKQHFIEELIDWIIEQPLDPDGAGDSCFSREDGYIDLAVISSEEANKEWHNSDREAIMDLRYLQLESIHIDDIWKPSDQLVFVRGVAGIGKSTLINRYVLKWARGEILSGAVNDGKIDFLFFFECRELNTMLNINNFEELIKEKYSEVLDYIQISDLKKIADRVMIIVDGLDELQGIYERSNESFPTTELVKTIINTKSQLLKGHKTIACGRPKACEFIKSEMFKSKKQKVKTIEVSGFNESNTMKYIERFFQNDPEKGETVKEIIKRPNIRMMSSVPVFLWVICLLYSEDFDHEINSSTELYTYGLFVFLKKHLRSLKHLKTLNELVSAQEFGKIVFSLTKLSVKTYMKHQVVFTDDDIKGIQCPIHLEQTGFIVKHSAGKFGCERYQFRHLAFQEYLSALYLCLSKGVSNFNTNRELTSCTPTILGIHHLVENKKNELFVAFYRNLTAVLRASRTLAESAKSPLRAFLFKRFVRRRLDPSIFIKQFGNSRKMLGYEFTCDVEDFKFIEFIRNFRENGWLVSKCLIRRFKDVRTHVYVNNVWVHEFLDFLRSLEVTSIDYLSLHTKSTSQGFRKADLDLIQMANKSQTLNIIFFGITGHGMHYYSSKDRSRLTLKGERKDCLPSVIKNSALEYVISSDNGRLTRVFEMTVEDGTNGDFTGNDLDVFDNVYLFVADLAKHVLDSESGDKKLTLLFKNVFTFNRTKLARKLKSQFGYRKQYVDKIIFASYLDY